MKKMLLATALATLITGCCSTSVYCSKQTGSSSTKGNHRIIFFVSGIGQKKTVEVQPKFVAAQKMLLNKKPANIRKWIARFYYFRHLYSAGRVCAHNNVA